MRIGFELRNVPGKGEGVFATASLEAGDTAMVGVIKEELDANHSHASQIAADRHVLHDGLISKVNHSCDPNCGISVNDTGAHDFVAMADIGVGDELTFDYAMRNYAIDHFPAECMCGSKGCRGRVTGWKDLPDEKKQDYEGFVAPYLLELDAEHSCVKA